MSDILAGKVVVVTSASSGLGRAASLSAARHGAKAVVVADVTETPREGGCPTVAAVAALGVAAQFVRTDVTKRGDVDALVARLDGVRRNRRHGCWWTAACFP